MNINGIIMELNIKSFLLLFAICTNSYAQGYEPNTRWPYLYEEFTPGIVYMVGNMKINGKLNIHLVGNVVHYVGDDDKIYRMKDEKILRVEIGDDAYIIYHHEMMKIVSVADSMLLLKISRGDFNSMLEGQGAYGSSLNSSATRSLSSLGLGGFGNPDLAQLMDKRYDGETIPLVDKYYFLLNGTLIDATKKGVLKYLGDNRSAELKEFFKQNKVKWKDSESLSFLLGFIAKQIKLK